MNQVSSVLQALASRKWRWVTLAVLLIMAGLARLGFWQLDRLEERRVANAELLAVLTSDVLNVNTLPTLADPTIDFSSFKERQAIATGRFDFSQQGIIKLQTWQGQAGVHLIAPLVLADGETAVLVHRGWIPEAEKDNLSHYQEAGEITVEGYIALTQTLARTGNSTAADTTSLEWFRVDIDQIQQSLSYNLLPIYLIQNPAESLQTTLPFRAEQEIDLSEGPHLGYAIQWFIFSLIGGVGYWVVVSRSLRESDSGEQSV